MEKITSFNFWVYFWNNFVDEVSCNVERLKIASIVIIIKITLALILNRVSNDLVGANVVNVVLVLFSHALLKLSQEVVSLLAVVGLGIVVLLRLLKDSFNLRLMWRSNRNALLDCLGVGQSSW